MSSRKTLILIAAVGVGIFAGIALLNYVRGIERDVYDDAQPVGVLIATADIPEGTPVADAFASIEVSEVPLKIRPATFISPENTDPITGLVARSEIPRNQIIVSGLFVDPTVVTQSLRDQIPEGNVAFSMEIDTIRAVGGYLQPGDEVNMMINHAGCGIEDEAAATETEAEQVSGPTATEFCTFTRPARYLYQRVEILAIGARQALQTGEATETALTPQGGTITFLVPNEAAQLLASVSPEDVYLTLLPEGYEVEDLPFIQGNYAPGEDAACATPYGPDGFIEGDSATVENTDTADFANGRCAAVTGSNG